MSEKAVSLEELLKKKSVSFREMIESYNRSWEQIKVVKENKKWILEEDVLKIVEAFVAGLRDLRNDFPKPELKHNQRYNCEVIANPQAFASLCWKWKKRFDVSLEGEAGGKTPRKEVKP